jgi:hypothetical protein
MSLHGARIPLRLGAFLGMRTPYPSDAHAGTKAALHPKVTCANAQLQAAGAERPLGL